MHKGILGPNSLRICNANGKLGIMTAIVVYLGIEAMSWTKQHAMNHNQ